MNELIDLCILETIHWITLTFYIIILAKAIFLIPSIKACPHKNNMGWILYTYLSASIIMACIFIHLQLDWIIANYDNVVETSHAILWAIYDVANAFAHLFFLLGLEVWLKWKCVDNEGNVRPRRRKDDP